MPCAECQVNIEALLCAKYYDGYREQRQPCFLSTNAEPGTACLREQGLSFCMQT